MAAPRPMDYKQALEKMLHLTLRHRWICLGICFVTFTVLFVYPGVARPGGDQDREIRFDDLRLKPQEDDTDSSTRTFLDRGQESYTLPQENQTAYNEISQRPLQVPPPPENSREGGAFASFVNWFNGQPEEELDGEDVAQLPEESEESTQPSLPNVPDERLMPYKDSTMDQLTAVDHTFDQEMLRTGVGVTLIQDGEGLDLSKTPDYPQVDVLIQPEQAIEHPTDSLTNKMTFLPETAAKQPDENYDIIQSANEGGSFFSSFVNIGQKINLGISSRSFLDSILKPKLPSAVFGSSQSYQLKVPGVTFDEPERSPDVFADHYDADWESLDSRPVPRWYEDAKIGIFIHWGVYSVPSFGVTGSKGAGEWFWYYLDSGIEGEAFKPTASNWVRRFMQDHYPPGFTYAEFAPMFKAEFFNPDEWASLFRDAGAKYVVLTSKHHDGYALWGSKHSWNWNSVDVGPHRDIVGELAQAVRNVSLRYGLYHSLYEWFNPLYRVDAANNFQTQRYVQTKLTPELNDLVMRYQPDILWADGDWEANSDYFNSTQFLSWLYTSSPVRNRVVTNDRWGHDCRCKHGGYLTCRDRYNPGTKQIKTWENCMTIDKESWGYRRNAKLTDYLTIHEIIETLVQTISHGGNILINVGPSADGRILPIFEQRLRELGEWLAVNGRAIYYSRMWDTPKDPSDPNVYYTKRPSVATDQVLLYAIVLKWPLTGELCLAALDLKDGAVVRMLGYDTQLEWSRDPQQGIRIRLPLIPESALPCRWAWVLELEGVANI